MIDTPDSVDQIRLLPEENSKCYFWQHNWSKWEDTSSGTVSVNNKTVGRFIYQERRCSRCNKVNIQKIQTDY